MQNEQFLQAINRYVFFKAPKVQSSGQQAFWWSMEALLHTPPPKSRL